MHYFKKIAPKTKVLLSTGHWLAFENVDNEWGIYPPAGQGISDGLAGEIRGCIQAGRGGITEISQTEYAALVQKKNSGPLPKRWREEIAKGAMQDTTTPSQSAELAAARPNGQVAAAVDALRNPVPPSKPVAERPTASRARKKAE